MSDALSLSRLYYLLRGDFIAGYRSLFVVSATLSALILLASMFLLDDDDPGSPFHIAAFTIALFTWGIIASSRAFLPLHDKTRNEAYLLIPASSLEKTLARLLAVTVGIVAFLLVLNTLLSLVVEILNLLLFGARHAFFNPLDFWVWTFIFLYIVFQSLYFLGAAWFRRRHFIKTTLAITLIGTGLLTVGYITARIAFAGFAQDFFVYMRNLRSILERDAELLYTTAVSVVLVTMILLALACWSIAWMRVAENQVSDGV